MIGTSIYLGDLRITLKDCEVCDRAAEKCPGRVGWEGRELLARGQGENTRKQRYADQHRLWELIRRRERYAYRMYCRFGSRDELLRGSRRGIGWIFECNKGNARRGGRGVWGRMCSGKKVAL